MLRTFRHGDRFWSIDRQGTSVTVRQGQLGGKERSRQFTITDEKGWQRYRRMVSKRVEEGFVEQVPAPPVLGAAGQALEAALVEDPDDLAAHMAYADWLSEQRDPRLVARGDSSAPSWRSRRRA